MGLVVGTYKGPMEEASIGQGVSGQMKTSFDVDNHARLALSVRLAVHALFQNTEDKPIVPEVVHDAYLLPLPH